MTIIEAIKYVLSQNSNGLTSQEIYDRIIEQNLYEFGAQKPTAVVNGQIRRRCSGLEFPTALPIKLFKIVGFDGKRPRFSLLENACAGEVETPIKDMASSDILPEEKMLAAYAEHINALKRNLMEAVLNNSPSFFEHLVMDLLLKMGYGYGKNAGVVTGRSHDGGVDGIISEDKLGLDLLYIQAKRYNRGNTVGRKELQAFVGAMENIQKGVFITSSSFTNEARNFVKKQQQKNIKLIDGNYLADLLIRYEVGINRVQNFTVHKIDFDYYGE